MLPAGTMLLPLAVRVEVGSLSSYEAGILGTEDSSRNPALCVTDIQNPARSSSQ